MKKYLAAFVLFAFAVSFALLYGCGQSSDPGLTTTTSVTTTTIISSGVVMEGKMTTGIGVASALMKQMRAMGWPPGTNPTNPNYPMVLTTPESYAVGIWRARLFKGLSDTTPYLMASWEAAGGTPQHFDLSSSPTQMAVNASYPDAGTYTHMIPTLAYLEQQLPASLIDFNGITKFRVIMATYGTYQRGEVLVYSGGAWKWINDNTGSPESSKPASPVMVDWGDEATVEVNGHIVFEPQDVSMEGFTIPSSPSGVYTLTMVFDVAGTFAFNDLNENGTFEPSAEYPAGDHETAGMRSASGEAVWSTGPPGLSMTATNET